MRVSSTAARVRQMAIAFRAVRETMKMDSGVMLLRCDLMTGFGIAELI
jgi:hypothetical protein